MREIQPDGSAINLLRCNMLTCFCLNLNVEVQMLQLKCMRNRFILHNIFIKVYKSVSCSLTKLIALKINRLKHVACFICFHMKKQSALCKAIPTRNSCLCSWSLRPLRIQHFACVQLPQHVCNVWLHDHWTPEAWRIESRAKRFTNASAKNTPTTSQGPWSGSLESNFSMQQNPKLRVIVDASGLSMHQGQQMATVNTICSSRRHFRVHQPDTVWRDQQLVRHSGHTKDAKHVRCTPMPILIDFIVNIVLRCPTIYYIII